MTEARADKPKRLSRGVVRLWAWVAGALAFFSPWVALVPVSCKLAMTLS